MNEIFETMAITSAHDSNSDDSDANESDSDANKSNSNIYFKSDDFNSNNKYDHELHEKFLHEEMAQLAKLKEKTPTKPKGSQRDQVNDDVFDKILIKIHKNHDIYFNDPVSQSVMSPTISLITA